MNNLQKAALKFASKHDGYHSFSDDKQTVDAICGLHNTGLVKVNEHGQFTITAFGRSKEQITDKEYNKIMFPFYH
jgi:DNA/RNA endonuclease YhcR with UshA esterase domain